MKELLKSLHILSEKELQEFDSLLKQKIILKNDFLIKNGQVSDEIAYIKSGVLRSFYISSEGEEITNCITFENQLMSAYSSFITQTPTNENIQALTNTELLILPRIDLQNLYTSSANWQNVGRILSEIQYVDIEKRMASFQMHNAERRYQELLRNHPEYLQLIPLKDLASFLGISSRHLGRLRKKISF